MRELFLLNIGGMKYGVWKDEILSIKDLQTIQWLPPICRSIAGMSILEGRTLTPIDLAVCIGLSPVTGEGKSHILVLSEREKVAGFVVEGEIGHLTIPPNAVFPMPDYLRTPVLDTCVMHASEPIPVINISMLHNRVQKAEFEPPVAEFRISGIQQNDTPSVKTVRVFESGGESFAVPGGCIEKASVKPGRVSSLALIPQYVRGIVFHNGSMLPLIHLSRLMKQPKEGTPDLMLVADLGGQGFGFLVDSDRGNLHGKNFMIKPLPPLVQSGWMRAGVVRRKEIIPLIDLGVLMSTRPDGMDEKPLPQRYSTASRLQSIIGKEEVEVVEFSLLGARSALPKSEVEDSFPFRPYRQVPNVQPIVAGVTEHDGELLPVLDLAVCFGRRSPATPEWRMIAVKNGDFRALVMTEAVFGERRVPVKMQRSLPVALPHSEVYGCYPDPDAVRLILNVEALVVYFDKARGKDFPGTLSREMEQVLAEIAPALLESEAAIELVASVGSGKTEEGKETHGEPEGPVHEEQAALLATVPEPESPQAAVSEEAQREPESGETESRWRWEAGKESLEPLEGEREEGKGVQGHGESAPPEVGTAVAGHKETTAREEKVEIRGAREMAETEPQTVATISGQPFVPGVRETAPLPVEPARDYSETAASERRKTRHGYAWAALVALVAAMLYLSGVFEKRVMDKAEKGKPEGSITAEKRKPGPVVIPPRAPVPEMAPIVSPGAEIVEAKKPTPGEPVMPGKPPPVLPEPPRPLVPKIPPTVSTDLVIYIVKKGDTLWAISKRFTGNPFNYPAVAKQNGIQNPNLIFPGQKIRLKK